MAIAQSAASIDVSDPSTATNILENSRFVTAKLCGMTVTLFKKSFFVWEYKNIKNLGHIV
jgi:hypothetical protein